MMIRADSKVRGKERLPTTQSGDEGARGEVKGQPLTSVRISEVMASCGSGDSETPLHYSW